MRDSERCVYVMSVCVVWGVCGLRLAHTHATPLLDLCVLLPAHTRTHTHSHTHTHTSPCPSTVAAPAKLGDAGELLALKQQLSKAQSDYKWVEGHRAGGAD